MQQPRLGLAAIGAHDPELLAAGDGALQQGQAAGLQLVEERLVHAVPGRLARGRHHQRLPRPAPRIDAPVGVGVEVLGLEGLDGAAGLGSDQAVDGARLEACPGQHRLDELDVILLVGRVAPDRAP
ncbi:MAG: hypothetical protein R3F60_16945 [bacterium]